MDPTATGDPDTHRERFERDGLVVVERLVDAVTIAPLRHAARILFAADRSVEDPPADRPAAATDVAVAVRRISAPGELHPVFAAGSVRDALTELGQRLSGAPIEVVREELESTPGFGRCVADRPLAIGSPVDVDGGIRCWLPLGRLGADDAPTPPGVALAPGDCLALAAGVTADLPPSERARTALVVTLAVTRTVER